jgi:hypothetical protein
MQGVPSITPAHQYSSIDGGGGERNKRHGGSHE